MKAHYRTASGRLTIEVEGNTSRELFGRLSEVSEVFDADATCGCCQGRNLIFRIRTVDGNEFYELYCQDCMAALSFGQRKDGRSLFPKRKDYGGGMLPNRGWKVWKSQPATEQRSSDDDDFGEPPAPRLAANRSGK